MTLYLIRRHTAIVIVDGTDAEILRAEAILKRRGIREWEIYNAPAVGGYVDPSASRL